MLLSLNIKNLIIIEQVELSFGSRFNVITGETGSGKSVLLDCLSLCFGGRNNNVSVKKGSDKGSVVAEFDISKNIAVKKILNAQDIEIENSIIIKRSFSAAGRSQIYINNEPVSLNILKEISPLLLEMYGQHDFSNLLDKSGHILILDEYADVEENKITLKEKYDELRQKQIAYERLSQEAEKIKQEEDYLRFILSELKNANIYEGEENELVALKTNLKNSKHINDSLNTAAKSLSDESLASLYQAHKSLIKLSESLEGEVTEKLNNIIDIVDRSTIDLHESRDEVENILSEFSSGSGNLEEIEDRLYAIRELSRKHRKTTDELVIYTKEIEEKLSVLDSGEHSLDSRKKEIENLKDIYLVEANKLSKIRQDKARLLEAHVLKNLPDLKMPAAKFLVEILPDENNITPAGIDNITFKASINPGQNFTDISKTASGGELSRLMLAIKIALSKSSNTCVIFDEIDTGISGATADAVGLKLKELSINNQVLCITHQPQVASKADNHYLVFKKIEGETVSVSVSQLDQQRANEEVARLISGELVTDEARAAAEKLKVS